MVKGSQIILKGEKNKSHLPAQCFYNKNWTYNVLKTGQNKIKMIKLIILTSWTKCMLSKSFPQYSTRKGTELPGIYFQNWPIANEYIYKGLYYKSSISEQTFCIDAVFNYHLSDLYRSTLPVHSMTSGDSHRRPVIQHGKASRDWRGLIKIQLLRCTQ